jgi:hypothetical protein
MAIGVKPGALCPRLRVARHVNRIFALRSATVLGTSLVTPEQRAHARMAKNAGVGNDKQRRTVHVLVNLCW